MKIMSYNIHMANRLDVVIKEFKNRNLMKDIAILCLQEASRETDSNTCQKIIQAFPDLCLSYKFAPFFDFQGKTQANAIIYRDDILIELDYKTFELPNAKIDEIQFMRKLFSKGFFMDKIICQDILFRTIKGKTIRILNTHLNPFTTWMHTFYQFRKILEKCKRHSRRVDVMYLCGDLNTIKITKNDNKHFIRFREFLKLQRFHDITYHIKNTYQLKSAEVQSFVVAPTITRLCAYLRIPVRQKLDWILIRKRGKKKTTKKATIIEMPGSDHYPVITTMDI